MPVKPHCSQSHPYLGESCPCQSSRKIPILLCACGASAVEIFVDKFGEWPICSACLAREIGVSSSEASPESHRPDNLLSSDHPDPSANLPRNPYGLTDRQMDIARLAHLRQKDIAAILSLSPNAVRSHMRIILRKLNVSSHYDIPYVINLSPSLLSLSDASHPGVTPSVLCPHCNKPIHVILSQ